jgi:hypothetical protein
MSAGSVAGRASASTAGSQLWSKVRGGFNQSVSIPALAVNPSGSEVFVAGYYYAWTSAADDFVTVAYDIATGTQIWLRRYNGPADRYDEASAVTASPDGSKVFVTGYSQGPAADYDYATVAYDASSGTRLWARRYNGPGNRSDFPQSLGVSPDGSEVFVTGASPGASNWFEYATVAYDASSGTRLWQRRYNGPGGRDDWASALGVSPDGTRVFVTGHSFGITGVGYTTVAYDAADGKGIWTKRYNSPGDNSAAYAIGVSPDGSEVFVTGYGARYSGSYDYATVAYDSSTGAARWLTRYNGTGGSDDIAWALGVSPDGSQVFVTGHSRGSGSADDDYATVAYDRATGAQEWVSRYNGPADNNDEAHALGVSPDGSDVFVTGESPGTTGDSDYATVVYDASTGVNVWVARYESTQDDTASATALGVSADGSEVVVTGDTRDSSNGNRAYTTVAYSVG